MLRIALTGPSGSGKGYISALFDKRGIPCLDSDKVVHALYRDEAFSSLVAKTLGVDCLNESGTVDRKKLGRAVFGSQADMQKLLSLVYPRVRAEMNDFFNKAEKEDKKAAIIDAPQLFEAGFEKEVDRILCVSAPMEVRLKRVMRRDGISRADALLRFSKQMPAAEYKKRAHAVIYNSPGKDAGEQIDRLLALWGIAG